MYLDTRTSVKSHDLMYESCPISEANILEYIDVTNDSDIKCILQMIADVTKFFKKKEQFVTRLTRRH